MTSRGVTERRFECEAGSRSVPGLLWTPEKPEGRTPLVLLGHGASLHKRSDYILSLARRFVRHHGFSAAAIDGPIHGERRPDGGQDTELVFEEFQKAWAREGITDEMVADWKATLDALLALEEINNGPVGYWGLSMGTIFGLPLVAAEPRVRAAVLGLMGVYGPTGERMRADAEQVSVPVLFFQQWHDELIPRPTVLELFDRISSRDKRLHAFPGRHTEVALEAIETSEAFLARHLSD